MVQIATVKAILKLVINMGATKMTKFVKNLLGSAILLTLPMVSHAAEWTEVDKNKDFVTFIDVESIHKKYINYAQPVIGAWFKMENTPSNKKTTVVSSKRMMYFNCQAKTYSAYVQRIDYNKQGKVVDSEYQQLSTVQFMDIVPDSIVESLYDYTCLGSLAIEFFKDPNQDENVYRQILQEYPHHIDKFAEYMLE